MRVSVVIPVYQRQAKGARALRSVLAQEMTDMEAIVVDDASPDPFRLPADLDGDPRIRLIRHDANRGAGAARDTGIAAARGEWIAFLDSDDIWVPGRLGPHLAFAAAEEAKRPGVMLFAASGFLHLDPATGERRGRIPRASADPHWFAGACWFHPGTTGVMRREHFARIGDSDPHCERLEDLDWFLRFSLAGGEVVVRPVLDTVIEHGHKPRFDRLDRSCRWLVGKWVSASAAPPLPACTARRLRAYLDLERASVLIGQGDRLRGLAALARSFLFEPRLALHVEDYWQEVGSTSEIEEAIARFQMLAGGHG
jgi:glycosyltransferase involved in cell wall biosynthesis